MSRHISFGKVCMDTFLREQENISPHAKTLHRKGSKFTIEDLKENSKKYDENFKKLMKSVNTSEHDKYVKVERELNRMDVRIRGDLNILVRDTPDIIPTGTKEDTEYKIEVNKKVEDDFFKDEEEKWRL